MTPNQEQLLAAEVGMNMLMDDNIEGARSTLKSQKDSPYALAGLGICDFLAAAVGMEDERLSASMEALALAEKSARKHKSSNSHEEPGQWWTQPGMEYEVLIADLAAAQAVSQNLNDVTSIHIVMETPIVCTDTSSSNAHTAPSHSRRKLCRIHESSMEAQQRIQAFHCYLQGSLSKRHQFQCKRFIHHSRTKSSIRNCTTFTCSKASLFERNCQIIIIIIIIMGFQTSWCFDAW